MKRRRLRAAVARFSHHRPTRPSECKVDYKEVLQPEESEVFSRLRDWRKSVAESRPALARDTVRSPCLHPQGRGRLRATGRRHLLGNGPPNATALVAELSPEMPLDRDGSTQITSQPSPPSPYCLNCSPSNFPLDYQVRLLILHFNPSYPFYSQKPNRMW